MKRVIIDERRHLVVTKTEEEAYEFCAQTFIEQAKKAIAARASFSVALSGGSTPLPLYELLTEPSRALLVNWSLLEIFWGDERCVDSDDPESNFGNAMEYFTRPPLDQSKKHRLVGESSNLEKAARDYERKMKKTCAEQRFDLVLLGIGNDGHTASLFPKTAALKEEKKLYIANHISQKECWRLTMTFPAINQARSIYVLAFGRGKSKILKKILFGQENYEELPAQRIGTKENPACFVIDKKAAHGLGI
jgi:6-phosphogluconolactonase